MSGAGLKLLVILAVALLFGWLIWAVARRNAAERKDKEGKD